MDGWSFPGAEMQVFRLEGVGFATGIAMLLGCEVTGMAPTNTGFAETTGMALQGPLGWLRKDHWDGFAGEDLRPGIRFRQSLR